jgi:hypothetical protein
LPNDLVGSVSHELRQPLASVRGFTEMLLGHWADFPDSEKLEMLQQVLHEAKRLGHLVDELLDVSRLESGHMPLHCKETDLVKLASVVVADLAPSYPELVASIEFPGAFPTVTVDPFKLEQVVTNVVENACKYGSPGTVRIIGSFRPARSGPEVVLEISDHGRGIAAEDLPHIAEKFYRGEASEVAGLGLGLWISKGIVEAHGGELAITSAPGEGTTVQVTIPLRDPAGPGKLAKP